MRSINYPSANHSWDAMYPVFLLPLWLGFYWQRGLLRFSLGVITTLALLVASLAFRSDSMAGFWSQVQQMFALL